MPISVMVRTGGNLSAGTAARAPGRLASVATPMPDRFHGSPDEAVAPLVAIDLWYQGGYDGATERYFWDVEDEFYLDYSVSVDNRSVFALQPHVDNAISKTVNVAEEFPFDAFRSLYTRAWRAGLKGCTAFRPNPVTGVVVEDADALPVGVRCCDIEREAD